MHRPGEGTLTGMQEGYLLGARVRRGSTEMRARCQKSCLCRCICMQASVYCRHVSIQGAAQIKLSKDEIGTRCPPSKISIRARFGESRSNIGGDRMFQKWML